MGDFVQVEIEDNGRGISAKGSAVHFSDRFLTGQIHPEFFQRRKRIGLSIVHKIMEDHGGKVWATSREGLGTTMYFVLRKVSGGTRK